MRKQKKVLNLVKFKIAHLNQFIKGGYDHNGNYPTVTIDAEPTDPVLATCNGDSVCSSDCTTESNALTSDESPCQGKKTATNTSIFN